MAGLLRLEHRILEEFKRRDILAVDVLVALSGGLDSVAMLGILKAIAIPLKLNVFIGHIHHGWLHGEQGVYRAEAWKHCSKIAKKLELPFYSNLLEMRPELRFLVEPNTPLRSEVELRDFRYECLEKFRTQLRESSGRKTFLATAHNSNDQLETRMIQLIRGAGSVGVAAMSFKSEENLLRPILSCDRNELADYVKEKKLPFLEDPSNSSKDPFRNWLRNDWLVQLEQKRPGSMTSLARSLRHLSEENNASAQGLDDFIMEGRISFTLFLELTFENKKRLLARYMRELNMKNYGNSHVLEVIKRLDSPEKEHTFTLLKHVWLINTQYIKASPV